MSTVNPFITGDQYAIDRISGIQSSAIRWFYCGTLCIGAYIHMNDGTYEVRSVTKLLTDDEVGVLFWEHMLNNDTTDDY